MAKVLGVAVILGMAGWVFVLFWKKGIANFWGFLAEANERHGTQFGTSPQDIATVIGVDLHKGGVLAFDQANRKIAYLTQHGRSVEICPYEFVQAWRVTWTNKTRGGGARFGALNVGSTSMRHENVVLEITTNDIRRPLIHMPMSSLNYAKETAARLQIMINTKK